MIFTNTIILRLLFFDPVPSSERRTIFFFPLLFQTHALNRRKILKEMGCAPSSRETHANVAPDLNDQRPLPLAPQIQRQRENVVLENRSEDHFGNDREFNSSRAGGQPLEGHLRFAGDERGVGTHNATTELLQVQSERTDSMSRQSPGATLVHCSECAMGPGPASVGRLANEQSQPTHLSTLPEFEEATWIFQTEAQQHLQNSCDEVVAGRERSAGFSTTEPANPLWWEAYMRELPPPQ